MSRGAELARGERWGGISRTHFCFFGDQARFTSNLFFISVRGTTFISCHAAPLPPYPLLLFRDQAWFTSNLFFISVRRTTFISCHAARNEPKKRAKEDDLRSPLWTLHPSVCARPPPTAPPIGGWRRGAFRADGRCLTDARKSGGAPASRGYVRFVGACFLFVEMGLAGFWGNGEFDPKFAMPGKVFRICRSANAVAGRLGALACAHPPPAGADCADGCCLTDARKSGGAPASRGYVRFVGAGFGFGFYMRRSPRWDGWGAARRYCDPEGH